VLYYKYRNYIYNEKDLIQNQIKNFAELKNKFSKQKKLKKEELKKLFLADKKEKAKNGLKGDNKININEEKVVEIELSDGLIIKEKESVLKKYPNSTLAACFNLDLNLPKRKGRIFIDRESESFKLLLYYLENNKLPKFKGNIEEKKFFNEVNYWKIPIHISSKNILKFNSEFCPHIFTLDKKCQILSKSNMNHGIVLLNKKLTALTPYIEFNVCLNIPNKNRKILLALIDEKKIEKSDLNKSFENSVPFAFYWDLFNEKIVKANKNCFNRADFRSLELKRFCRCFKNNYETKFGLIYNHQEHSVELVRDDIKLNISIQNIDPGLTPALEIHTDNCKIELSSANKYQEKFFL
jgi:hypothetical protein